MPECHLIENHIIRHTSFTRSQHHKKQALNSSQITKDGCRRTSSSLGQQSLFWVKDQANNKKFQIAVLDENVQPIEPKDINVRRGYTFCFKCIYKFVPENNYINKNNLREKDRSTKMGSKKFRSTKMWMTKVRQIKTNTFLDFATAAAAASARSFAAFKSSEQFWKLAS